MIIKLKDGMEIVVTQAQADGAEQALDDGVSSIKINDIWIRADWIAVIKPGGEVPETITDEARIIDQPDYRGRPSPAKEKLRKRFKHV